MPVSIILKCLGVDEDIPSQPTIQRAIWQCIRSHVFGNSTALYFAPDLSGIGTKYRITDIESDMKRLRHDSKRKAVLDKAKE